jgi:hypothetical protein
MKINTTGIVPRSKKEKKSLKAQNPSIQMSMIKKTGYCSIKCSEMGGQAIHPNGA